MLDTLCLGERFVLLLCPKEPLQARVNEYRNVNE